MKWRMTKRIAPLPKERWTSKIFDWHPGLDNEVRTRRPVGRPKKRWEDDINDFVRREETKDAKGNDPKNNCDWMNQAKSTKNGKQKKKNKRSSTLWVEEPNMSVEVFCLYPSHTAYQGSFW